MFRRLLALTGTLLLADGKGCTDDHGFDFFMLVQQYPPSFKSPIDHFTLHGLWPSRPSARDGYPCYCTDQGFDEGTLSQSVLTGMKRNWPTLMPNVHTSHAFWEHEWTKHGTCAAFDSMETYFNATLSLRNRTNLTGLFENSPLLDYPPTGKYPVKEIARVVHDALQCTPVIHSRSASDLSITLCVSTSLALIECPVGLRDTWIDRKNKTCTHINRS
jgi:ribonuclease T2